jgi:hypothetical protein
MFATLEDHDANPPSTWVVEKAAPRIWHLNTAAGGTLESFPTKKAATAAKVTGHLVRAYEAETRWMGGETPRGHRSYAECQAERARIAARWAKPTCTRTVRQLGPCQCTEPVEGPHDEPCGSPGDPCVFHARLALVDTAVPVAAH